MIPLGHVHGLLGFYLFVHTLYINNAHDSPEGFFVFVFKIMDGLVSTTLVYLVYFAILASS